MARLENSNVQVPLYSLASFCVLRHTILGRSRFATCRGEQHQLPATRHAGRFSCWKLVASVIVGSSPKGQAKNGGRTLRVVFYRLGFSTSAFGALNELHFTAAFRFDPRIPSSSQRSMHEDSYGAPAGLQT